MILKPRPFRKIRKGRHWSTIGLVGFWPFYEGDGVEVLDLSGNGKTGTFVGNTHWVPGKFGSALDFDGTGDYVNVSPNLSNLITGQVSVVAWVKGAAQNNKGIISERTAGADHSFVLRSDSSSPYQKLVFLVQNVGDVKVLATTTTAVLDGFWHQVIGTYDGINVKIYIDGLLEDTQSHSGSIKDTVDPFVIGQYENVSYFTGQIDLPMIYNHALSASKIALLYQEPFIMFERDPIELWVGSVGAGAPPGTILPQITSAYMRI